MTECLLVGNRSRFQHLGPGNTPGSIFSQPGLIRDVRISLAFAGKEYHLSRNSSFFVPVDLGRSQRPGREEHLALISASQALPATKNCWRRNVIIVKSEMHRMPPQLFSIKSMNRSFDLFTCFCGLLLAALSARAGKHAWLNFQPAKFGQQRRHVASPANFQAERS